jgi:hypothetical protein
VRERHKERLERLERLRYLETVREIVEGVTNYCPRPLLPLLSILPLAFLAPPVSLLSIDLADPIPTKNKWRHPKAPPFVLHIR